MPRRSLTLALALALLVPGAAGAQSPDGGAAGGAVGGPPVTIQPRTDGGLDLVVPCVAPPDPRELAIAIDGGPPRAPAGVAATELPLSVALVVEASPAMGGLATPLSTRRADAALLAAALLERLPADSQVALLAAGAVPHLLAPLGPPAAARALIERDQAGAPAASPPMLPDLAAALAQAHAALAVAPPGPRAVLLIAATAPGAPGPTRSDPPEAAQGSPIALIVIDLGAAPPAPNRPDPAASAQSPEPLGAQAPDRTPSLADFAARSGAAYLPYATRDLARLPELLGPIVRRYDTLVGARGQLRLTLADRVAPGVHQISLSGSCGQASASLTVPAGAAGPGWLPPAALAGATGAALAVGAVVIRRRAGPRARGRATPLLADDGPRPVTARFRAATDAPTERRGGVRAPQRYELIVRDGERSTTYPFAARQYTIGRDSACDLVLDNAWISTLHARVALAGDQLELTDLDSTNGTYVGAERRRLAADRPELLEPGEPAWVGPEVQLIVRCLEGA